MNRLDWDWLAGFFDADGSVGSGGNITFYNSHRHTLLEIQAFLNENDIESNLMKRSKKHMRDLARANNGNADGYKDAYELRVVKSMTLGRRVAEELAVRCIVKRNRLEVMLGSSQLGSRNRTYYYYNVVDDVDDDVLMKICSSCGVYLSKERVMKYKKEGTRKRIYCEECERMRNNQVRIKKSSSSMLFGEFLTKA
jgi:intein/homing endonuclease